MHTYVFHLGRERALAAEELYALLTKERIHVAHKRHVGEYLLLSTDTPLEPQALMASLGGTRLIGEKIPASGNAEEIAFGYLASLPSEHKLHFSLSGTKQAHRMAIEIKKKLKKRGRSIRYVTVDNTASILHNNLVEKQSHLIIVDNVVYVTRAIQPIEAMSRRDYDRPAIDDKSGMLPPKLARMMVNLTMPKKSDILLDPFCGSGTLLGEAMSMGIQHVIGSDISEKAVEGTKENLTWLQETFDIKGGTFNVMHTDVRRLTSHIDDASIHVIATEPYMGVPRSGKEQQIFLQKQAAELTSLYLDAFKTFYRILASGGRVVFAVPRFKYRDNWITIDIEQDIRALGFARVPYTEADMPLVYQREGQHVVRELWRWQKEA